MQSLAPVTERGPLGLSRGVLMLRCAQAGLALDYVSVESAIRRGPRPPKLCSDKPMVDRKTGCSLLPGTSP
jgi:hypothetical protein